MRRRGADERALNALSIDTFLIRKVVKSSSLLDNRQSRSAEGESEPLGTRVEELDREFPLPRFAFLADQLVEALAADHAVPVSCDVGARIGSGRLAVQRHPEAHRPPIRRGEHQMQ